MLGGNVVFRKMKDGSIIMANAPKPRKGNSEAQQESIDRFSYAVKYAKHQMTIPERKDLYKKGINNKHTSAHAVARQDLLNPPEIIDISAADYRGVPGDMIRVWATDDFRVATVTVSIFAADSSTVETGLAIPRGKKGLWRFTTTEKNPNVEGCTVKVTVKDFAENTVVGTVEL